MDPFVAYPSRWRLAGLLALGMLFLLAGLWFVGPSQEFQDSQSEAVERLVLGWAVLGFFGACTVVVIRRLFDRRPRLQVDHQGVRAVAALWPDRTILWSEIEEVTTWHGRGQSFMVLRLRDRNSVSRSGPAGLFQMINRFLTGGDLAVSLSDTNRTIDEALSAVSTHRPKSGS